jgi:cbb3-type cytochrome oxidase subunit 3
MIKYIRHHFDTIIGVEIYPIISLILFFVVFITMLFIVFKLPKKSIEELSNLPLDNDIKNNSHE